MEQRIIYVGLDVHKDTIAVALAEAGKRGSCARVARSRTRLAALRTLAAKLASHGWRLRFCYEAGPCGYGIQRQLSEAGHECVVVAPSLIPRKPGDRVKTDRRDAINLAKLHRAGELSSVWVPDPAHEAIRDLVRARLAAVRVLRQARQQLSGFLLRHGHHYNRPAWTLMHRRWLAGLSFEHPAHYIVLEDCIATIGLRIEASTNLGRTVEDAGYVQECVPEALALKRDVFRSLDASADPKRYSRARHRQSACRRSRPICRAANAAWSCIPATRRTCFGWLRSYRPGSPVTRP